MLASRVLLHMREQVATPREFWSDSGEMHMNSFTGAFVKSNDEDDLRSPTSPHDCKFGSPQSLRGKGFA